MADDDSAADSIPVALVASLLVMAIIVGFAAVGLKNATPAIQLASADRQVGAMANDCRFLLSLAPRNMDDPCSPKGAFREMEIVLPDGTEYLSFGRDPDSGDGHPGTIYYKVCGTKKSVIVDTGATFKASDGSSTILRSGRYDISFEYARDVPGHRYLLISNLI
ncbi:MAG: hypothetical protein WBZ29_06520 [Methanocella sp.]